MDLFTSILHLVSSGVGAYFTATQISDSLTRPNLLAGFQLAESGSVSFLTSLSQRATQEGDKDLAAKLAVHAQDEERHGQIFANHLRQMGKRVIDLKTRSQHSENTKQQSKKRNSFFETYFEGYNSQDLKAENIDWLVFMGSTYILELDASKDFKLMANVLSQDDKIQRRLKAGLLSIAQDETRHAAYLFEAMQSRFGTSVTQETTEKWRTRKVQALIAMISNLMQKEQARPILVEDITSKPKLIVKPKQLIQV